jgi:multidrug efflux pump subunit AcrA (membrane-fusion protein)
VEGTVRVIDSAADAGLQADDIAVITTADIESVTLLGTPAAVLTDGATRLCSGMRVRVDGSAGLITVLALDCEVVGA